MNIGFRFLFLPIALISLALAQMLAADAPPTRSYIALDTRLDADAIVSRMMQKNLERAAALHSYEGHRSYSLSYRGFPSNRQAEEQVVLHYVAPDSKRFEVVSESGSKVLQSKIFAKLMEGEREAAHADNQRQTALTTENYIFTLLGEQPSPYGGCYRLAVQPRRENKFLYRGEICVNGTDFAVESIDAEPAKNPSFWIKKTRIEHRYQRVGQFWLPASNHTVTNVRLGGTATLSILYTGYDLH